MKLLASLLTAAVLAAPVFSAFAAGDAPKVAKPDLVKGEASYTAVCAACHGADGNSAIAVNPTLAQQHPEYLVKQLQEFKSGKRNNAVMKGFATALLTDEDMKQHRLLGGVQASQGRFRQGQGPGGPGRAHLPRRHCRPQHCRLRWLPQPQRRWHPCAIPTPVGPAC
jgi:cytochrome c553